MAERTAIIVLICYNKVKTRFYGTVRKHWTLFSTVLYHIQVLKTEYIFHRILLPNK